jgi:tripartite-type tricarboxylate transporter receptor subunit TctC
VFKVEVKHPFGFSSPAKSVQDLIDLAKKSTVASNFASSGVGNSDQMATELFKEK